MGRVDIDAVFGLFIVAYCGNQLPFSTVGKIVFNVVIIVLVVLLWIFGRL